MVTFRQTVINPQMDILPPEKDFEVINGKVYKPGQFRPGNTAGKNKPPRELVQYCREQTFTAVQVLTAIMTDDEADNSDRIKACNSLLDRGWGKPPVQVHQKKDVSHEVWLKGVLKNV